MEKKERNLSISTMVIIMAIVFFVFKCERSTAQTWQHHFIEEGYLMPPFKSEVRDKHKVKVICNKLDIDPGSVIKKYHYSNCWTFGDKTYYFHKFKYYIPVKKSDFDSTKTNIFGKEKFIINKNEREMYKPQID